MKENLRSSYLQAFTALQNFIADEKNISETVRIAEDFAAALKAGNKGMICGNGGSTCDALHFAEEFTGRYRKNRPPLPVMAIAESSHLTCVANDFGFDYVFSRGVEAFGKPGDFLFGISTSGSSQNVINAIESAKKIGMKTVGILGKDGGKLKGVCDYEFVVPGVTADRIQEIHMTILHIIIEGIERTLYPELY